MWGWFGGTAAAKKKDLPKKAIIDLRQQLEMLQKREKHVEQQIADQDAIARKNVATNKNIAKAALKRKKLHEHTLLTTQSQIATLEQQMHSIETANLNYETLKVMKSAGEAMKGIHGGMTLDKVDETMDEIRDQVALAEEIGEAITRLPLGEPVDEDELQNELDQMEQEELNDKMLGAPAAPVTATPSHEEAIGNSNGRVKGKARVEDEEEEELKKLQAEMAM